MRSRLALTGLVILVASGASLVIHRSGFSRPQTKTCGPSPCGGQRGDPVPHELNFAYYSLRDSFNSTLLLVSDSPNSIEFALTIRSLSGKPLLAPPMTIPAGEKLAVDLARLLTDLGADTSDFREGSLSLQYTAAGMRPLVGQVTITNPREHLVYESFRNGKDAGRSDIPPVLNALWWGLGAGREATIAISNTGNQETVADVFLDFQGTRHKSDQLEFDPHETKVLSISELLSDLDVSPAQAPEGGITIVDRAQEPALIGQGRIIDPETGFSTTLNFLLTPDQRGTVFHASGVPIGTPSDDSPFAEMGTFTPHAIVRNLSGSAQSVAVIIDYPSQEGPHQFTLPPISLAAYTTQDISLDQAMTDLPLPLPYCSIRVQYSGPPGSAIAEVSSVEEGQDLIVDSRLGNEGDSGRGSGNYPWHLDDETDSVLFLTNMGDNDNRIAFQIQAGVTWYSEDLKLGPRETRAINIRKMRDD